MAENAPYRVDPSYPAPVLDDRNTLAWPSAAAKPDVLQALRSIGSAQDQPADEVLKGLFMPGITKVTQDAAGNVLEHGVPHPLPADHMPVTIISVPHPLDGIPVCLIKYMVHGFIAGIPAYDSPMHYVTVFLHRVGAPDETIGVSVSPILATVIPPSRVFDAVIPRILDRVVAPGTAPPARGGPAAAGGGDDMDDVSASVKDMHLTGDDMDIATGKGRTVGGAASSLASPERLNALRREIAASRSNVPSDPYAANTVAGRAARANPLVNELSQLNQALTNDAYFRDTADARKHARELVDKDAGWQTLNKTLADAGDLASNVLDNAGLAGKAVNFLWKNFGSDQVQDALAATDRYAQKVADAEDDAAAYAAAVPEIQQRRNEIEHELAEKYSPALAHSMMGSGVFGSDETHIAANIGPATRLFFHASYR
jgi:hypothetical protein